MRSSLKKAKPKIIQTSDNEEEEEKGSDMAMSLSNQKPSIRKSKKRPLAKGVKPIDLQDEELNEGLTENEKGTPLPRVKKPNPIATTHDLISRRREELNSSSGYTESYVNELKSKSRQTPVQYTDQGQLRKEEPLNKNQESASSRMLNQGISEASMIQELRDRKERQRNIGMMDDNYIALDTGQQVYLPGKTGNEDRLLQHEDEVEDEGYNGYNTFVEDEKSLRELHRYSPETLRKRSIQNALEENDKSMDEGEDITMTDPIHAWEQAQIQKGAFADPSSLAQLPPRFPNILTIEEQKQRLKEAVASEKLQQEERAEIMKGLLDQENEILQAEERIQQSFMELNSRMLENMQSATSSSS
ncbi:spliceosome complex disassembly protein Ntr2 [Schizosaccharomyces osmophilus]|uniref:Spliceosome complex disassembly protein Ntr2 n=1 Tax=Schizosaccharomyces osmophilus TaxID=2545709 RepID=A0AAE9WBT8_9SCHI|nr:spliceosome complex disassembly protein Ntr2 [Schizosaccharomyces osmophilus]WBW73364.1 spliceosome complex disassembly protein Ntr2 [Schizosaccharomyces osmophilus]